MGLALQKDKIWKAVLRGVVLKERLRKRDSSPRKRDVIDYGISAWHLSMHPDEGRARADAAVEQDGGCHRNPPHPRTVHVPVTIANDATASGGRRLDVSG